MMRITAILAALMVCATAASAAPMVAGVNDGSGPAVDVNASLILSDQFLQLDVILVNIEGIDTSAEDVDIKGFGLGITLGGAAAPLFSTSGAIDPAYHQKTPETWTGMIGEDDYLFATLYKLQPDPLGGDPTIVWSPDATNARGVNDPLGMTQSLNASLADEDGSSQVGVDPFQGAVIARMLFNNVGGATAADLDNLVLNVHKDGDDLSIQPYLIMDKADDIFLDVVPEPATMGLLGLGLLGVLARRKK